MEEKFYRDLKIPENVLKWREQVINWRREFHRIPEPGFKEHKTSKLIKEILGNLGVDKISEMAGTGIVALINGNSEGACLAIRADIDALPVEEKTSLPFRSLHPGYMHACGHDGHIAMALGAAAILCEQREKLQGTVKFIFQPGEEGYAGAREMIKAGCLRSPDVDVIIGLHLWNFMQPGTLGICPGPMLAAADEFHLSFSGPGGHGAAPHEVPDPILAACNWAQISQTITARKINALEPAVISVGKINGGSNFNVIADRVSLSGTARSFSPEIQNVIENELQRSAENIASLYDVSCDFEYIRNYPPTVNDPGITQSLKNSAEKILKSENIIEIQPSMVAEDMSYYLQEIPGTFFFLGSSPTSPEETPVSHHSSVFNVDENVFVLGTALFVQFVRDYFIRLRSCQGFSGVPDT